MGLGSVVSQTTGILVIPAHARSQQNSHDSMWPTILLRSKSGLSHLTRWNLPSRHCSLHYTCICSEGSSVKRLMLFLIGSTHVLHVVSLSDTADQIRHLGGYETVLEKSIDELQRRVSDARTVNRPQRCCRTQYVNSRSRLACNVNEYQLNKFKRRYTEVSAKVQTCQQAFAWESRLCSLASVGRRLFWPTWVVAVVAVTVFDLGSHT